MGALREGAHPDQPGIETDDRSAVAAADGEADYRLTGDQPMLDDPVDRAADQLVGAPGHDPGDARGDAVGEARALPRLKRLEARAGHRDLAHMELGHDLALAN